MSKVREKTARERWHTTLRWLEGKAAGYRCAAGNYRLYSERVCVFGAFTIAFERSLANYGPCRSDGKMWRSAAAGCEKIVFNLKPAVFDASPGMVQGAHLLTCNVRVKENSTGKERKKKTQKPAPQQRPVENE